MTQYVIKNSTQSTLEIVDSSGIQHALLAGSSITLDLSPSWYLEAVANVGASNVVPVPLNSYKYSGVALTPVATPTDVIIIQGSASMVVRIKKIKLSGVATAQGNMPALLIRRSSAGTLGSAALTAVTAAKIDNNDAAATAVVSTVGTANFGTVGTAVATIEAGRVSFGASGSGTGGSGNQLVWDFDEDSNENLVLRGTSDFLAINLNGAAVPSGGVLDYVIETTESAT